MRVADTLIGDGRGRSLDQTGKALGVQRRRHGGLGLPCSTGPSFAGPKLSHIRSIL